MVQSAGSPKTCSTYTATAPWPCIRAAAALHDNIIHLQTYTPKHFQPFKQNVHSRTVQCQHQPVTVTLHVCVPAALRCTATHSNDCTELGSITAANHLFTARQFQTPTVSGNARQSQKHHAHMRLLQDAAQMLMLPATPTRQPTATVREHRAEPTTRRQ